MGSLVADSDGDSAPCPKVGRLDTLPRCRREAVRLYIDARQGRIPAADASRLAVVLTLIMTAIRDGELEARIATLESRL